ncbi:iron-containing redox enzyme family protein [Streptomyces sp. AV19]|uniref:TenA family transcriptional regulator n=1 Tax=Streptomyces sp. AV19 TaxID=2793068 RepID=UPI0018FE4A4D|nr:iron-containing redox enzyme family protein [Streptomyces sp. AV19]MBH1937662.1 iron-containing redox enzyme family protein [Streptomyces sp. AV19]MDG4536329.1 iron-containing redox enzyme family protein [Streptomyces sp. AV19]
MTDASCPPARELTDSDLAPTPDVPWVAAMVADLRNELDRMRNSPFLLAMKPDESSDAAWRHYLREAFRIVESFPKYMAACLARTTFGQRTGDLAARDWLIGNISTEARHARWYIDWAMAHGATYEEIVNHVPGPEMTKLHRHLWTTAHEGTPAEVFTAVNYVMEGVTGEMCVRMMPVLRKRFHDDPRPLRWLTEHAEHDDVHPRQALELAKLLATDAETQERAARAAVTSLRLYREAVDSMGRTPALSAAGAHGAERVHRAFPLSPRP